MLAYALLYAAARFIIEYWRDDPRGSVLGLSTSQFIALAFFVLALIVYFRRARGTTSESLAENHA